MRKLLRINRNIKREPPKRAAGDNHEPSFVSQEVPKKGDPIREILMGILFGEREEKLKENSKLGGVSLKKKRRQDGPDRRIITDKNTVSS